MDDKKPPRTMGLDVGSRTIGVAVSDELGITAQGLKTIRRKSSEEDLKELSQIIRQFEIKKLVVGLPKNMDGSLGKQAEVVFKWIKSVQQKLSLPIVTWDERLSKEAERGHRQNCGCAYSPGIYGSGKEPQG